MTTPTLPSTTTIRYVGPCPACSRDCTWTQATTDPYQMARTVTRTVRKIAATPGTKVRLHWITVRMVLRPSTQATYRRAER